MKVKDIMKTDVAFCGLEDNLMRAAELMRFRDCGAIPVVDEAKRVVGMLTDRDVCLAVVARNRKASDVKAKEIIKGKIIVCSPEDKIEDALKKMRKYQIKRLAAASENGELVGIFSITDVLNTVRKNKDLKKRVFSTLQMIFKPEPIVLREISAEENNL